MRKTIAHLFHTHTRYFVYFLCECFYVTAFVSFGIVEHQSCNARHTDGVGYPTHTQIENQLIKN